MDEPTQMVVMHHAKPNKLQCLALQLADKVRRWWVPSRHWLLLANRFLVTFLTGMLSGRAVVVYVNKMSNL